MDNELAKDTLKTFVHSDVGDAIVVRSLRSSMDAAFSYLEDIKRRGMPDHLFQNYVDNIAHIRGCLTVLQWYTADSFDAELIRVNQHSLKLEEVY
jgi:hypothetical protein